MRYLSPASLPTGPLPNPPDARSLALVRKKLLAELELSTDGTLNVKGQSLSKNDILEYFDTLQNETILHYHEVVSNDKVLKEFLETGEIATVATFAQQTLYSDEQFRQWLSPFFYTAFIKYIYACLENTDEEKLITLLHNPILLTEYHRECAWLEIEKMLEENVAALERYCEYGRSNDRKGGYPLDDIAVLITDSLTRMILMFPQNRFSHVRNNYAFAIMQVSIIVFNKNRWKNDLVTSWMANAKRLAMSEDILEQIDAKTQEMEKKRNSMLIRGAVVIGFVLLRVFGFHSQDSSSTNFNPENTTVIYNHDTVHNLRQLDSLMKKTPTGPMQ